MVAKSKKLIISNLIQMYVLQIDEMLSLLYEGVGNPCDVNTDLIVLLLKENFFS